MLVQSQSLLKNQFFALSQRTLVSEWLQQFAVRSTYTEAGGGLIWTTDQLKQLMTAIFNTKATVSVLTGFTVF